MTVVLEFEVFKDFIKTYQFKMNGAVTVQCSVVDCNCKYSALGLNENCSAKILYMRNSGSKKSPILRCRRVIYECKGIKPFFFIYDDEILTEQLIRTGSCGDFMVCLYYKNELNQNAFVGQWIISLNFKGRFIGTSTFFERDGVTPIDNSLVKVEINVLVPLQLMPHLKDPSESEDAQNQLSSYDRIQIGNDISVLSGPSALKDICVSVSDRHRRNLQRRFEKRQSKILEENERMYRRLRSISVKPRTT